MTRGFIRLSVVVILLTWMGAAFFQWRHLEADIWHIERHISPYLRGEMSGLPITKREWPAYAATPGFLALSEKERVQVAAEFYESHVRWLEREYFVGHEDALKKWFVKTARLGVNEAPVQYFFAAGLHEVPFRNFGVTGIAIAPRLSYVLFSQNVMLLTALISVAVVIVLILATLAIRWVHHGFAAK